MLYRLMHICKNVKASQPCYNRKKTGLEANHPFRDSTPLLLSKFFSSLPGSQAPYPLRTFRWFSNCAPWNFRLRTDASVFLPLVKYFPNKHRKFIRPKTSFIAFLLIYVKIPFEFASEYFYCLGKNFKGIL